MVEHRIEKVMKRDGTIVDFDQEKVTIAIYKAAAAVGGHDRELSEKLSDEAVEIISHSFEPIPKESTRKKTSALGRSLGELMKVQPESNHLLRLIQGGRD